MDFSDIREILLADFSNCGLVLLALRTAVGNTDLKKFFLPTAFSVTQERSYNFQTLSVLVFKNKRIKFT